MIVIFRSRSLDSVLVAIIAGTEQPNPTSIGTKLLPEKPQKNNKTPKNNGENGEKKEHNGLFRKKKFTDKIKDYFK